MKGTKALREGAEMLKAQLATHPHSECPVYGLYLRMMREIEAIERAAKDLTRLHLGDGVYDVRDSAKVMAETPDGGNTWNHPDVKAWSDAATLLESIAKETT